MKSLFFFSCYLLLTSTINAADQGTILLHKTNETDTEVVYALEAVAIKPELIGISTTLLLPEELSFKNYQAGIFFEEEADEVTYLISPKKNNPHELIIGIATLGQSTAQGSGSIVNLTFGKHTITSHTTPQIVDAVASGMNDGNRVNYDEILWKTENALPITGPFPLIRIFIVSTFISCIGIFYKISLYNNFSKRQEERP